MHNSQHYLQAVKTNFMIMGEACQLIDDFVIENWIPLNSTKRGKLNKKYVCTLRHWLKFFFLMCKNDKGP